MALSGTLSSLGLDDVVGFLSTHGVEGVLTICGPAAMSLRMIVLPGRIVVPEPRHGRLSAESLDALLARAARMGSSRRLQRQTVDELVRRARREPPPPKPVKPASGAHRKPTGRHPAPAANGHARSGPASGAHTRPAPPSGIHRRPAPPSGIHRRPAPPSGSHARPAPPSGIHRRPAPPSGIHARPAPPSGIHARPAPPSGIHARPAPGSAAHRRATASHDRPQQTGRVSREALDDLLARADALSTGDAEKRRHRIAEQVHQVSAGGSARFEFTPCALSSEVLADIEAMGGMSLEPLALLMEVARLADESQQCPDLGRTILADSKSARAAVAANPAALEGDIDGVGLAALLQTLRERRRAGTLSLRSAGREEKLYFIDGEAYALRLDADDEFAHQLLGADAADSVRVMVRDAAIDEATLTAAEQARLRERFLDVLFGEDAMFAFFDSDLPPEVIEPRRGLTRISLQTERFLLEAIQRMVEWDDLRTILGDGRARLRFVSEESKLDAIREYGAREVLTMIDGRLTFNEVVRIAQSPRLEAARVVVALARLGVISTL